MNQSRLFGCESDNAELAPASSAPAPVVDNYLQDRLLWALKEYDAKESSKRCWNPNAMRLYIEALNSAMEFIDAGKDARAVLVGHFTGRLCARLLKVAGCSPYTIEDARGGSWVRGSEYPNAGGAA